MKQCLMIQTNDNRRLFTHERNLPQLVEFSKTFNSEISIVQIDDDSEILELEEFVPAFCEKKSQKAKYRLIEVKLKPKCTKTKIVSRAKKIKNYIKQTLLSGKPLSLKALVKKYKGFKLTTACLCNHFTIVREELKNEGHKPVKLGQGQYKLN